MSREFKLSKDTKRNLIALGIFGVVISTCCIGSNIIDSTQRALGILPTLTPIPHFSGQTLPSCFAKPDGTQTVNVFSHGQATRINGHTVVCEASVTIPNQPNPVIQSLWKDTSSPDSDIQTSSDGGNWTVPKNRISFWFGGVDATFYSYQYNHSTKMYDQIQPTTPTPTPTNTPTATRTPPPTTPTAPSRSNPNSSESNNAIIVATAAGVLATVMAAIWRLRKHISAFRRTPTEPALSDFDRRMVKYYEEEKKRMDYIDWLHSEVKKQPKNHKQTDLLKEKKEELARLREIIRQEEDAEEKMHA